MDTGFLLKQILPPVISILFEDDKKQFPLLRAITTLYWKEFSMKNPCEIIARYIHPAFRSLIAKDLMEEHGFTQIVAAAKLGTTQAAISHYLPSKRGEKYINLLENNLHVETKTNEIIEEFITTSCSSEEVTGTLYALCIFLRDNDQLNLIQEDNALHRK